MSNIKYKGIDVGTSIPVSTPLFNVSIYNPRENGYHPKNILFTDIVSLKHWFVSLDLDYLHNHDIILTYE